MLYVSLAFHYIPSNETLWNNTHDDINLFLQIDALFNIHIWKDKLSLLHLILVGWIDVIFWTSFLWGSIKIFHIFPMNIFLGLSLWYCILDFLILDFSILDFLILVFLLSISGSYQLWLISTVCSSVVIIMSSVTMLLLWS